MAWLGSWAYRRKITIAASDVDAGLSNFPVLLKLGSSSGKTSVDVTDIFDEIGANKLKIAITTSDGTTQTYAEVVEWDDSGETAEIHFRATSLSSSSATDFYIYYDNSQSDNTTYIGAVGSTPGETVWDSNYVLVMHLAETSGNYLDSTSNDNDSNSIDVTSRTRTGLIGQNCPDWNRANTDLGIDIPDTTELRLTNHTLEIIVYHDSWQTGDFPDMIYHREGSTNAWYSLEITNSPYEVRHRWSGAGFQDYAFDISTGSWVYLGGTADTGTTTAKGYRNDDAPDIDTGITNPIAGNAALTRIGYDPTPYYMDGAIDEVRISDIARPEAWMLATNLTLKDNFITLDAEEPSSYSSSSVSFSSSSKSSSSTSQLPQWVTDTYCEDEQWVIDTYCEDEQWIPASSSSSSSSESSSSSSSSSSESSSSSSSSLSSSSSSLSSSSTAPGTLTLGHSTGVVETYNNDFEVQMNWQESGNVTVTGTGDSNALTLGCPTASIIFDQYLGAGVAKFTIDKYGSGSGPAPQEINYKTATTRTGLDGAGWNLYNGTSFNSLGWVRVEIVH